MTFHDCPACSRGCLSQLWDACIRLAYECAAAPENAADVANTACRRMLPHILSCILGWKFAEGDGGWCPRYVRFCQRKVYIHQGFSVLMRLRYTFSDSKSACFYPGANWTQRLAAVDILGPILSVACSCRYSIAPIFTPLFSDIVDTSDRELRSSWRKLAVLLCGMRGKVWGDSTHEMDKFCSRCVSCAMQLLQVKATISFLGRSYSLSPTEQAPSTAGDPDVLIDASHMIFRCRLFLCARSSVFIHGRCLFADSLPLLHTFIPLLQQIVSQLQ